MKVAICDDESRWVEEIKERIEDLRYEETMEVEIDCFTNQEELLEKAAAEKYHLIYLDIEMEGKNGIEVAIFQLYYEGALVDCIQQAYGVYDGIVINPAAYTHTSVALLDALKAVSIPAVEVHISDVSKREAFRQVSYVRYYCEKTIAGHGFDGYIEAMAYLKEKYGE